jgi:hypothetical protein
MSYYDKYLKYKNKYIQYKNKVGINMHGGAAIKNKGSKPTINNDIFNINHLTDTPFANNVTPNKSQDDSKSLSIEMLTNTPGQSDFAGGSYKPKPKNTQQHNKLLKLLASPSDSEEYAGASNYHTTLYNNILSTEPRIKDSKSHRYFKEEMDISPSSTSSSSSS